MVQIITNSNGGGGVGLYKYKGSVDYYEDLPTSGMKVGDTYNVVNAFTKDGKDYPAGTNVAWTGTDWDPLGGSIDLSDYQKKLVEGEGIDLDQDTNEISVDTTVIATKQDLTTKQDVISDLDTIRSNASAGKTAKDTIDTYGNIVTHNVSEFATAAQGALADTAVQPGDNVSDLVNDAGYLVSSDLKQSDWGQTDSSKIDYIKNKPTIGNATLTIQRNGTQVNTFTANATSNVTANISVPTKTSDITNDSGFITKDVNNLTNYTLTTSLASVATSGSYNDLSNKPSIPTKTSDLTNDSEFIDKDVNNLTNYTLSSDLAAVATSGSYNDLSNKPTIGTANLTVQKNGTTVATFGANATSGVTANITVPTKVTDLSDAGDYTKSASLATVATTGDYDDLIDKPTIPGVINNLTSTSTTDALSAAQGKALKDALDNISGLGKFLSLWDSTTGQPISFPLSTPYTYTTGDWFMVETVGATNYKPNGSSYTGTASTTVESGTVKQGDVYIYDGTSWLLQVNNEPQVSFSDIAGQPTDNSNLATALGNKQDVANMVTTLSGADNTHYPTAKAVSDAITAAGGGDMLASVYDPNNVEANAFDYNNFINTPNLAAVATSGDYSDLSNTPTLATVATSGSYNDLSNKPTIPTVNNATLTIQKNGTTVKTFTANASSDVTANISVPTKTSDITNDSGYITKSVNNLDNYTLSSALATVATTGSYSDLSNKPTIPTDTSDLTNGAGFITGITSGDVTTALGYTPYNSTNPSGYVTSSIINDTAYGSGWNADTTHAPTKNAVYDKISAMDTTISGKQDTLTAGENIKISSNVISANNVFIITEDDVTVSTDDTKGVAPYNTSYGYTNIDISANAGIEWREGAIYTFVVDTEMVVASAYRNVRVKIGTGNYIPVMGSSAIIAGHSYFAKNQMRQFQYSTKYEAGGALHLFSDSNTTYSAMSVAEGKTGTATSGRVVTAANLKQIIQYHSPVQSVNGQTGNVTIQTGGNYTAGNGIDITNEVIGLGGTYNTMQGPAPSGFHVPSKDEWVALVNIWTSLGGGSADSTNFGIALKLPFAGLRDYNGTYYDLNYGHYWSCTNQNNSAAYEIRMTSSNIYPQHISAKAEGFSIRAFKDLPVVPTSSWTKLYGTSIESGGIFWSSTDGLISLSSNGQTWITIADKNLGATTVWNSGSTLSEANCGKFYQRGNNYGFPYSGTVTTSSTQVDASNYGPGNYYESSTFITPGNTGWDTTNNTNLWGGETGTGNLVLGDKLYKIVTSTTAPASGTASNIITIVTD